MSDTGWVSPGTMADDDTVGTVAWSDVDNAKASDENYSIASYFSYPASSHYLKATNFGFSIPSGATIDGIEVQIQKFANYSSQLVDSEIKIVKSNGTVGSENKADTGTNWPTSEDYISHGASDDDWGETWAYTDINDSDFGVVISTQVTGAGPTPMTTQVDHIQIKVYYTESADTPTVGSSYPLPAFKNS